MDITETNSMLLKVADLRPNEGQMEAIGVHANPRQISETDYQRLLASLREKNMTGILPLKVYNYEGEWYVLGGNMRLRAMQELGIEKVSCIIVPEETDAETLNEFIIKDNSTYGEWDMDALANEWADSPLNDWGVDVPKAMDESAVADMFEDTDEKEHAGEQTITIVVPVEMDENIEEIKTILREAIMPYRGCYVK